MILFMIGLWLGMIYFGFKLFRIYTQTAKYQYTKKYLTFFAALSLSMVACTFVTALTCYLNFGKGLKDHCKLYSKYFIHSNVSLLQTIY